jgi:hypothetical protein
MPRKKKPPEEWTDEEAIRKLFPRKVVNELHRLTEKEPKPQVKPSKSSIKREHT